MISTTQLPLPLSVRVPIAIVVIVVLVACCVLVLGESLVEEGRLGVPPRRTTVEASVGQYNVIAIGGSRSNCSCCGVPVVVFGGKDVMVAMLLIADASTSLLMIKDC